MKYGAKCELPTHYPNFNPEVLLPRLNHAMRLRGKLSSVTVLHALHFQIKRDCQNSAKYKRKFYLEQK